MNPMTLKIMSLYTQKQQPKTRLSKSIGGKDFASLIKGLTNPVQIKSSYRHTGPVRAEQVNKKYAHYLENLRKNILVKGKALEKVAIGRKDIPVLKEFLIQCGFASDRAEEFLEALAQNSPDGDINLSHFFARISELAPPKAEPHQPVSLDPSTKPYIESALRHFGLTPREVQNALNAARGKGGELDLNEFVAELKEIANKVRGSAVATGRQNPMPDISKKLQDIGIQIPHGEKGKPITLEDLIMALDKMTARKDETDHLPTHVKATIDKIVDKVVAANDKGSSGSAALSVSKPKPTPFSSKESIGRNNETVEKQGPASSSKDIDFVQSKVKVHSRLEAAQGPKEEREELRQVFKSKLRRADIAQEITRTAPSERMEPIKQNQAPLRHSFPAYLIDQVGKQVARSILRAEKTLRLQLKPPELGALKVEMAIKDSILRLGVSTENTSVKELLLSNVNELRETLVQQGIKLEKVDIQVNYDFGHALANSKEGLREGRKWHQAGNEVTLSAERGGEDSMPLRQGTSNDRLLDLMA